MNVSIINIGDELLIGQVVNTNATQMSQMLITAGIEVHEVHTIADDSEAILSALQRGLQQSDAVLITGGLGPTKDDITKHTLCQFFQSELYENAEALANIQRIFDQRGYELTDTNRMQAWVPRCCTMINNVLGTAPCMWFSVPNSEKVVVAMPGVPFEMLNLMETEVVPRLCKEFRTGHIISKNILVQGIGESFLSDIIEPWERALPQNIRLAYLPQAGMVKLRITIRGTQLNELQLLLDTAVVELYPLIKQYVVGEDFETLPAVVAHTMTKFGKTLATAESCTGGALASSLTAMAGASAYYRGGIVAYSNEVKECALGVQHNTLLTHGAVSEATVCEMAVGVRERLGADYAVATTGIAGPDGGSADKPVGTVWIAIATPHQIVAQLLHFGDRRTQTIERTCNTVWSQLVHIVNAECLVSQSTIL